LLTKETLELQLRQGEREREREREEEEEERGGRQKVVVVAEESALPR